MGATSTCARQVGLIASNEDADAAHAERAAEREALLRRLVEDNVIPDLRSLKSLAELRGAVHAFLCRTPARLVGLSLDDLTGEVEPVNVPGVGPDKYPSWTRKMRDDARDVHGERRHADVAALRRPRASSGADAQRPMSRPQLTATYRLQMNAGFTLRDGARSRRLLLAARRLASLSLADSRRAPRQHARLRRRRSDAHQPRARHRGRSSRASAELHARGMGIIVDIVPNHMGRRRESVLGRRARRTASGRATRSGSTSTGDADTERQGRAPRARRRARSRDRAR